MPRNPKQFKSKFLEYRKHILWGIVVILSIYFIYFNFKNVEDSTHGFASYYTASKLLSKGEHVSQFYDNEWFSIQVNRFVPEVYDIYNVNLPTTSLLILPLIVFDHNVARIIWTIFNVIIFFVAVSFILHEFNFGGVWIPLILIFFLSYQPLYANFLFGQAYILIFCLLVVAWYAYKHDNEKLLGMAIGLIFIFKSTSIIFWLFFLLQKNWRSLVWGLTMVLAVAFISLPWIGIDAWQVYASKITGFISNPSLSVTAYQTIHSFFYHLTTFNQQWNTEPLLNLPSLGKLLSLFSTIIITIVCSFYALKNKNSEMVFGAFIIVGVILSPVSLDYHYTILLLPILILVEWIRNNPSILYCISLLIFVVLIAAYTPYTSHRISGGGWAILAYPKLYGAIGLWGLSILASYQSRIIDERTMKN